MVPPQLVASRIAARRKPTADLPGRCLRREVQATQYSGVATGVHCNPGAAYRDVGVSEAEVESLAGEKEGCGDDVDFIEVKRPAGSLDGIVSDSDILPLMQVCLLLHTCMLRLPRCCPALFVAEPCSHASVPAGREHGARPPW